jgi:hypothetical protein
VSALFVEDGMTMFPVAEGTRARSERLPGQARARAVETRRQDGHDKQILEWLWLLLRFAITRDPEDEFAVMVMAGQIDRLGQRGKWAAPTFFRKSSIEVCRAIAMEDDPLRDAVLNRHMSRIGHARLRRTFQVAVRAGRQSTQRQTTTDKGTDAEQFER